MKEKFKKILDSLKPKKVLEFLKSKKVLEFLKSKKVILVILVLVIVAAVLAFCSSGKKDNKKTELQTAKVVYGNISKAIEGSGTIAAIDEYEVSALSVKGEVLECTFEVGDIVEKDEILYKIDSSDMERSIENAQKSLEKAQSSYNDTLKDYNETMKNQNIYAPQSGVIYTLNAENGKNINNGSQIAVIRNSEEMILDINFNSNDAKNIFVGDACEVSLGSSYTKINGTVTRVGTGDMVTGEGAIVRNIEIKVKNPGALKEGDMATATVGMYACNSEGSFRYLYDEIITARVSGEVYNLNYKQGDYIEKGALLLNIDSKYKESTLKNAKMSLDDAKDNLERLYEDLEDYTIKAPIGGEIVEKNFNKGEKIDATNGNQPLAIIHDSSTLYFDMSIDELDITNIKEGQDVKFTADSFDGMVFTGYVDKVKKTYTSQQGVTSYPVTVIVNSENQNLLLPGMNVSASIIIEERQNVLVVPVSAVRRGNVVIAKTDSEGVGVPNKKAITKVDTDAKNAEKTDKTIENNSEKEAEGKKQFTRPEGGFTRPEGGFVKPDASSNEKPKTEKTSGKGLIPDVYAEEGKEKSTDKNGSFDMTGKDSPFLRNLEIPDGYKAIFVETGLSDDNYIEIVSGLNEGDTVALPDSTVPSSTNPFGMPQGGGMMGTMPPSGMGGAMPQGNRQGGMSGTYRQGNTQSRQGTR